MPDKDPLFMKYAIELSKRARGKTLPNPMVGAVIVKDGKIMGTGYHRRAGGPHAEVYAIRSAGKRALGATLYVTLEPCCHYGKTPPCTDLIIESGVKKVVIAMVDPNPLVSGKGIEQLTRAGIQVRTGVLEDETRKLNEVFIKNITKKMPYVIFKEALTIDGRTATSTGDSKWISSEKSREFVHRLRSEVDGVMVGVGTVIIDNPSLTTHGIGKDEPLRIIVDSKLKIPLNSRVLNDRWRDKTLIATSNNAPRQKIKKIESKGARVIRIRSDNQRIDLRELMKSLYRLNIYRLLVEGGPILGGALLREKLIDRFIFFISPKIIGEGRGVFEGFGLSRIKYAKTLKDVIIKKSGEDIIIEGRF